MARRRVMEYGPSVRTPRNSGMQTVSETSIRNTYGVIHRSSPGLDHTTTVKSKLSPRTIRGITPPGYQAPNYSSPEV